MCMCGQTPWLTIQSTRPGVKKKAFWKRKKRSQRQKLRILYDEVGPSLAEQQARIETVAAVLSTKRDRVR